DRLLHLRRQSAGGWDAAGVGYADRTISSDFLVRERSRPPPGGCADSFGRKQLAGTRPLLILRAARFRWPARDPEFARRRRRLRSKRLDSQPPASRGRSRRRFAEKPARSAFPNHYRDGIADRDLDLRRLD